MVTWVHAYHKIRNPKIKKICFHVFDIDTLLDSSFRRTVMAFIVKMTLKVTPLKILISILRHVWM